MTAEIRVPALLAEDRTILIPEFWLGDIEYRKNKYGNKLSAAEYNTQMQLPTLAELRHAFAISKDYRHSPEIEYDEWTSTFLRDGKEIIERPENVFYRGYDCMFEGGKVTPVELPPCGWIVEYDKPTGFPSETSQSRQEAEKRFGDDASYFYAIRSGVRAVLRKRDHDCSFSIYAAFKPDYWHSIIGGRACRRSE